MEKETEKILEKIRRIRIIKKITQFDLALEAGIAHSHMYYIESKRVIPSIDVLVKIAKALRVPLADLLK
ncbi:MAG: helix-turn-helix domain-containing protein [Candidatus Margulisbacteria bacterium]|jgi:transcriptional regulator with XRE-family HTH domain|nr:helix-turn-helix domain-containing protein [Candidatus Margulisiibacteriota bacterium]